MGSGEALRPGLAVSEAASSVALLVGGDRACEGDETKNRKGWVEAKTKHS